MRQVGEQAKKVWLRAKACKTNTLIYKTAEFEVPEPSAIGRGGRNVESKVTMRTLLLTNDMSLGKGARLLVKDDLPAALEDTT